MAGGYLGRGIYVLLLAVSAAETEEAARKGARGRVILHGAHAVDIHALYPLVRGERRGVIRVVRDALCVEEDEIRVHAGANDALSGKAVDLRRH